MEPSLRNYDTPAWRAQVAIAFCTSLCLTTWGIWYLPVDAWIKGYLGLGLYFTVSSCFSLAKTIRDHHEAEKIVAKISEARAEKMLREYGAQS